MSDLFEGFRWREVLAVVTAIVFFLMIMIDATRDIDAAFRDEIRGLRERVRTLEVKATAQECLNSPEICRAIQRGD